MADFQKIRVERSGACVSVRLDTPPLNVLDIAMLGEMVEALDRIARDPEPPHVVVIRGEGAKAFSAGASVADHTAEKVGGMLERFHGAIRAIAALPPVVIAAVHGHCLGGGLELAAACDLVMATESAKFSQPEIDLACFPPVASAWYPNLIGEKRAAQIVLLGGRLTATQAQQYGLINEVVPDGELDATLARWVDSLCAKSRAALAIAKRSLRIGASRPPLEALDACEKLYLEELVRTEDMNEGIRAFMEKRKPSWRGR